MGRCLYGGKLLGSRTTETYYQNKAKNQLHTIDYFYVFINSFIEMVFIFNLFFFGANSADVVYSFDFGGWDVASRSGYTIWNTLVASVFLILLDDAIYAPAHRFLHWKPIYPLVHKHHHRQKFPERGYLDAGNEHPVEQLIGLSIVYGSILITARLLGFHIASLVLTFVFYAFVNVVNHTSYDIKMKYLGVGFEFTVGAHEMHHRFFDCNYGKSCMWFDMLMGTYEPYASKKRPKRKTK